MLRYLRTALVLLSLVFVVSLGTAAAQGPTSFRDVADHWAQAGIGRFAAQGWVGGFPDGTFRPNIPLTRAEAVTMIDRILTPLTARLDRLEAQSASRPPAVSIDNGLAVRLEQVTHTVDQERLEVAVQGFVRNTGKEAAAFNPSQIVLIMQDKDGKTLGTIRPDLTAEAMRLESGEGRQVKAGFRIEGEQLTDDRLARLAVGVVDGQGNVQLLGITISLECSWPPLRCKLTIELDF